MPNAFDRLRGAKAFLNCTAGAAAIAALTFPSLAHAINYNPGGGNGGVPSTTGGAHPQTPDYLPPPGDFTVDPNGVDPKSLNLNYNDIDIVVGSGQTAFSISRSIPTERARGIQDFGRWKFDVSGYAVVRYNNSADMGPGYYAGVYYLDATVANSSLSFFREPYSVWEATTDLNSAAISTGTETLSKYTPTSATVVGSDGSVNYFATQSFEDCPANGSAQESRCFRVNWRVMPDGRRWDYVYEGMTGLQGNRIKSLTTNYGYRAIFNYPSASTDQPSSVCVINLATTYHELGTACPAGALTATYNFTTEIQAGEDYLRGTVTKPDGRQVHYGVPSGLTGFGVRNGTDTDYQFVFTPRPYNGSTATYRAAVNPSGAGQTYTYQGDYIDACTTTVGSCPQTSQNVHTIITDPASARIDYHYDWTTWNGVKIDHGLPGRIENQLQTAVEYTYEVHTAANGAITGYSNFLQRIDWPVAAGGSTNGVRQIRTYNVRGLVESVAEVSRTNQTQSLVHAATYPAGCTVPDAAGLNLPGNRKTCNKPLTVTDANGGVTAFTYSDDHGGTLTEMGPPPAPGGARPLKVRTYAQRYANVKGSTGALVAAATPVWVLSTETQCQTTAGSPNSPVCDDNAPAPKAVTSYEYGAAGGAESLLVKGIAVTADGQTLRTCYGYDNWGRKISETSANANLASCS
jgi:hypothetical protein